MDEINVTSIENTSRVKELSGKEVETLKVLSLPTT
jgi:hypothetical protein